MLISDQAKDLVKNCVEGGGFMSPFQPLVYIRILNKSIVGESRNMSGFGSVVIAAKVIYCVIYRKC